MSVGFLVSVFVPSIFVQATLQKAPSAQLVNKSTRQTQTSLAGIGLGVDYSIAESFALGLSAEANFGGSSNLLFQRSFDFSAKYILFGGLRESSSGEIEKYLESSFTPVSTAWIGISAVQRSFEFASEAAQNGLIEIDTETKPSSKGSYVGISALLGYEHLVNNNLKLQFSLNASKSLIGLSNISVLQVGSRLGVAYEF